jgi:hypothetical protein
MSIHPDSGLIRWTPANLAVFPAAVQVQVSDGRGGVATQAFQLQLQANVAVPALIGLSKPAAWQALQAQGLTAGTETLRLDPSVPEGRVLAQDPPAGAQVAAGAAVALTLSLGDAGSLPPDPATIAPPLDPSVSTTIYDSTVFIYEQGIQTDMPPDAIDIVRAAVLRGRVIDRQGNPLPGVTVSVQSHPEFGQTLSRADGQYDLVVNGGGYLSLNYTKTDYLPAQRQANVPWNDYALFDDVALIPQDAKLTVIDLSDPNAPMQVAQGTPVQDADGA